MPRQWVINGESMVVVRGQAGNAVIGGSPAVQLGLAAEAIRVTDHFKYKDMIVDAWGSMVPVDVQFMLAYCDIEMKLIHYDPVVLDACIAQAAGSPGAAGTMGRAGQPLGGFTGQARFAAGNFYIGVTILSPVMGKPYRFLYCYMPEQPVVTPFGTEKSITHVRWRAIPYTNDPWGGGSAQTGTSAGTGALGAVVWDNNNAD